MSEFLRLTWIRLGRHPTLVPLLFSVLMLGAAFTAGLRSGLADSASFLYINVNALAAAVSAEAHGLSGHPYETYDSVLTALTGNGLDPAHDDYKKNFRDPAVLAAALQKAAAADVCGSGLLWDTFNDQGAYEFNGLAFRLFGVHIRSLYYFYFLALGASMFVFAWIFGRNYAAATLLLCAVLAVYPLMSYVFRINQLISVSNVRFLSTLGIIPLLHVALTFLTARGNRISWPSLAALVFQAALMSFAIAIRSTALWMEIAFGLLVASLLCRGALRAWRVGGIAFAKPLLIGRGAVILYVVATFAILGAVRSLYQPPDCGAGLSSHVFWHNAFDGLSLSSEWHQVGPAIGIPDTATGDDIAWTEARVYAQRHHLPYQTDPTIWIETPETRKLGIGPTPFGSWDVYEQVMRLAFFEFVAEHPGYTLKNFLYDKPRTLLEDLEGFLHRAIVSAHAIGILLLLCMVGLTAALAPLSSSPPADAEPPQAAMPGFGRLLVLIGYFFVISSAPLLAIYSRNFLIADVADLLAIFLLLAAITLAAKVRGLLTSRA